MSGVVDESVEGSRQERRDHFAQPLLDSAHGARRSAGLSYSKPAARAGRQRGPAGRQDVELTGLQDVEQGSLHVHPDDLRQTASRYLARAQTRTPRLLNRGEVLGQCNGRWNIQHDWGKSQRCCSLDKVQTVFHAARHRLYMADPFHTIINLSTWKVLALFMGMYMVAWTVFALPYYYIARNDEQGCGMFDVTADSTKQNRLTFLDAFVFSVETMATIGYGAPSDIFFNGCKKMAVVLSIQTVTGLILDAIMLGVVFSRINRGSPRAKTILFSDRAVIRKIRGRYHLMFQVCEMRKHTLVEAHVRMYCVRKDYDHLATGTVAYFQSFPMRLQHPDDEMGGMLMMNLPTIVVHPLDAWSPLVPHPVDLRLWRDPVSSPQSEDEEAYDPAIDCRFPDVLQRQVDCDQGNRSHIMCEFCGETFYSRRQLERHMQYYCISERTGGCDMSLMCKTCGESFSSSQGLRRHVAWSATCEDPPEGWAGDTDDEARSYKNVRHRSGGQQESIYGNSACESRELIEAWLDDTQAEIIVLLEGIDATTSSTIQARHSYTVSELVWDATFAQIVYPAAKGTSAHCTCLVMDCLPVSLFVSRQPVELCLSTAR